jgi:hypothetical protein
MKKSLSLISIFVLTASILCWSTSSFPQSIGILNTQLEQAVNSRHWNQAIHIIDRMIILEPAQANRLKSYRAELIDLSAEIKRPSYSPPTPIRSYRKEAKEYSFSFSDVGIVSDSYKTAGNLYYLTGYFKNNSSASVRSIKIYYNLLHYFKERDSSGFIIFNGVPAWKSQKFEDLLPEGTHPAVEAVLIRRIEWIDEDGNLRVDDSPRRIEPYSSTPRTRKTN